MVMDENDKLLAGVLPSDPARDMVIVNDFERGDHVEIAARLVRTFKDCSPFVHCDGDFYWYEPDRGVFEALTPAKLSSTVQKFAGLKVKAGQTKDGKAKKTTLKIRAGDVAGAIRLAADQTETPEFFEGGKTGVAFSDVFVEVGAGSYRLLEHSPEHRARFAYPFPYDGQATPKEFLRFFDEVFRGDQDQPQKVALIQEYLGLCLLGQATRFQRCLVFVGDGSNGKGVASSIIERSMPPGSVCSIPPQDLSQEYRRAMLRNKFLNIVSELPEADILDSESWKATVAGDTTTGREIRKSPFSFKPVAGHIYSANRLPGTSDQTHGFWRRLLVIRFDRIFGANEQNPRLADEILASDRGAIVSWALRGAQRVLERGSFTMPTSASEALEDWKRNADQVLAFVEDGTARLPLDAPIGSWVKASTAYKSFRDWAIENGHRPMASNKFSERMRLLGLAAKHTKHGNFYPVRLEAR